ALKAVAAAQSGDGVWRTVRPPLRPLGEKEEGALRAALGTRRLEALPA
ncbi:MAG: hypothetical protein JO010_14025, partial [Alphaproteobacteria bacterium]|nr:hypothetical protein [Alphaproteobacteria bacterium]